MLKILQGGIRYAMPYVSTDTYVAGLAVCADATTGGASVYATADQTAGRAPMGLLFDADSETGSLSSTWGTTGGGGSSTSTYSTGGTQGLVTVACGSFIGETDQFDATTLVASAAGQRIGVADGGKLQLATTGNMAVGVFLGLFNGYARFLWTGGNPVL